MPPRTRTNGRSSQEDVGLDGPLHTDRLETADPAVDRQPSTRDATSAGITLRLPLPTFGSIDAKRLLWFGGLGALATVGVLDWPVALVVGTGTIIAARPRRTPPPVAPASTRQTN